MVLGLDADEAVSRELREEITRLLQGAEALGNDECIQFSSFEFLLRSLDTARGLVSGPEDTVVAAREGTVDGRGPA